MVLTGIDPTVCHGYSSYHKKSILSSFFCDLPCIFFHQPAGDHDLMSASHAFETEISSGTQHLPLLAPAGMRLLHSDNISHIKSVRHMFCSFLLPSLLFNPSPSVLPARESVHHPLHLYRWTGSRSGTERLPPHPPDNWKTLCRAGYTAQIPRQN